MNFFRYLAEVFYPSTCIHCSRATSGQDDLFCTECLTKTVFSGFVSAVKNEMTDRLVSISGLINGYAPLIFTKESPISGLFYRIKYGNRPDLAEKSGTFLGHSYTTISDRATDIDVITFVPIHPKKEAKRGYNQSRLIAQSVGKELDIPVKPFLSRISNIDTQTHYGRQDRLNNQENTIKCDPAIRSFHHVMIIDDILTTGATLETCTDAIRETAPGIRVSVATLAITDNW